MGRRSKVAIETCINIGIRIISIEQTKGKNIKTPETYADIFLALSQLDIVNDEFSTRLSQMAKFRNKLVHLYWEVDDSLVYRFIKENMKDFEEYICCIKKYLQNN
ncbi:type VII toxin-antitoxin system HepT family RNase toxin [Caldicellulosiruptor sp. DIB 104C]|uniref:type VII toxin-antitoxin system HepT family RNase toxin n=1 Tax=Caldicellulosiruptor sp. DIB 104C TaxID=3019889 RepID=UPI0023059E23|nr:HepT-like ribonuclease domain-containing protein [Caldicellulosiruptor sp. DIB 104C]